MPHTSKNNGFTRALNDAKRKHKALRIGQLMNYAAITAKKDLYYMEDEELVRQLRLLATGA